MIKIIQIQTMISLKEHNDLIEKLMKEITLKQSEIKTLQKQKTKSNQSPQLEPTSNEIQLNKKINQLQKQYKQRFSALTQQLRNKSIENKDLKERLIIKKNLQVKEKQHIAQILKKNYDRKPSTPNDYKVSALISHYEAQLQKKMKFIQKLQKQIKQTQIECGTKVSRNQLIQESEDGENCSSNHPVEDKKQFSIVQHQAQVNKMRVQMQKWKRMFEQKQKEYKDLSRRYSELTKEYYKIMNTYGIEDPPIKQNQKNKLPPSKKSHKEINEQKGDALKNLLYQMAASDTQLDQSNFSSSFQANVKQIKNGNNKYFQEDKQKNVISPDQLNYKLDQIAEQLGLKDVIEILPTLANMKAKIQEFQLVDNISRFMQSFLYRFGMGKIPKSEVINAMETLEIKLNKNIQAAELIDEVCIKIGAKRERVLDKIDQIKQIQSEYYTNLKNLKFTNDMLKSNKIIEFIEYFQLDKSQLNLPEQLIQVYDQLKGMNKFIKEVKSILEIDGNHSYQSILDLTVRYIEKTSTLMAMKSENRNLKKRGQDRKQ